MIIADDEPVITKGILKLVDWKNLGIEVQETYDDGEEAFKGIIAHQPEIALLDISMPGKTGLEILEEIKKLGIKTQIIFISGFEEFDYAKKAISLGAVDYLLKPIKKDVLIDAVRKCISNEKGITVSKANKVVYIQNDKKLEVDIFKELVDEKSLLYHVVLIIPVLSEDLSSNEKKLLQFTMTSSIEEFLENKKNGIIFKKNEDLVCILKGNSSEEIHQMLLDLFDEIREKTAQCIKLIVSNIIEKIQEIPLEYEQCIEGKRFLYFSERYKSVILNSIDQKAKVSSWDRDLTKVKTELIDSILSVNQERLEWSFNNLNRLIPELSLGRKEDACFYYYGCLKELKDKVEELKFPQLQEEPEMIFNMARKKEYFSEMAQVYYKIFCEYSQIIEETVKKNELQEIDEAKKYIESNYYEHITLEKIAEHVHMNPYYFSSYFKKHEGVNYKDFLTEVRLKHAVSFLVSSNLKTYEIAAEVGFGDARTFVKQFKKYYDESPAEYKKRILE